MGKEIIIYNLIAIFQHGKCGNSEAGFNRINLKEEFDVVVESIKLIADKNFMEFYSNAREQVKERFCFLE